MQSIKIATQIKARRFFFPWGLIACLASAMLVSCSLNTPEPSKEQLPTDLSADAAATAAGSLSTEKAALVLVSSGAAQASAGAATAVNRSSSAFEEAPPNLGAQAIEDHDAGDEAFEEIFVSTADHPNAGLGPRFNNLSCVSCHIRNGRGMPEAGQLLIRVGDSEGYPEVAALGNQIQDFSIVGEQPEASVEIEWVEQPGEYPDGADYSLRKPQIAIEVASTGTLLPDTIAISPRIPPPVHGLGLLEAISEADILANADVEDADGDGISGKANRVWNEETQEIALGRFGWKANSPTLLQQSAEAYVNDMGIHSSLFPDENGNAEISDEKLNAAAAYAQTLAVPARASVNDPNVMRGESLFGNVGCNGCHTESFTTSSHKYPALVNQPINPYTDLLLHDMGEELADYREDFEASGREWRTAPLWGIGLTQTVLPYSGFLHDGRARTLEEAILWHGGEADKSRQSFKQLPKQDRLALISFLQSL